MLATIALAAIALLAALGAAAATGSDSPSQRFAAGACTTIAAPPCG